MNAEMNMNTNNAEMNANTKATLKAICVCPLSGAIMTEPYILNQTGVSYQKEAIERHLATQETDPQTGAALVVHGITPNCSFQRFVRSNMVHLLLKEEEEPTPLL